MNILALVHDLDDMGRVVDYAEKIATDTDSLIMLNIINVPGDIPTKQDGEVLDFCTEFDLKPFLDEKKRNEEWLSSGAVGHRPMRCASIVGNQYSILNHQIAEKEIDIVLTSTEFSNESNDLVKVTRAGLLHRELMVPVLAFKCDKSEADIEHVAIVSDYMHPDKHDLSALRRIQEITGSTVSLYGFCGDVASSDAMKERMKNFASHHGLSVKDAVVIEANNKERSAQDLLMHYPIQLMVVMDIQRHGVARVLKGDLETDILNHTLVPILAY